MKTNYWSRLRVLTWAVLFAAGSFASCSDDDKDGPTPPPVQLVDQIEYDGGTPIDIKSAIFEIEDTDLYTFYLSPTAGITDMEGMGTANDYLRVMVRNPKGTVNTESDKFEISYKDISVKEATMKDVKSVKLSADYLSETARLNLYVEVEMESGKTLLARYENTCAEAKLPELNNQYELNGEALTIGSVLKWSNPTTGATTYYFYNEANITEPQDGLNGLTVTLAAEATETTFDLSTVDPAQVSVKYGAFQNTENTTGSLTIEANNTLTLAIDAEEGDNHLRAAYSGAFTSGFESANLIKATKNEDSKEAALAKVFLYNNGTTNILTFGMVEDAETPADLMKGSYAVSINLSSTQLNESTIDLSEKDPIFHTPYVQVRVFDYVEYRTWDNSTFTEVSGSLITRQEGDKTYLKLVAEYKDGVKIESEWCGAPTTVTKETDMTPVAPFRPRITITKEDGSVVLDKTVTAMEMRLEKNYRLRGGDPQYGGATFDAQYFYFRFDGSDDDIETTSTFPQFMLNAAFIPTDGTLNLAVTQDNLHWNMPYTAEKALYYAPYSENYEMYGMKTLKCPDNAKVTITKDEEAKTWDIKLEFTDYGLFNSYSTTKDGTKNTLVIEWKGPATKYSGTKTNNLTDEDY